MQEAAEENQQASSLSGPAAAAMRSAGSFSRVQPCSGRVLMATVNHKSWTLLPCLGCLDVIVF